MAHADSTQKNFTIPDCLPKDEVLDMLSQEFNSFHRSTFQYEIKDNQIKVTGLEYLVNWLYYLMTLETERATLTVTE